MNIKLTEEDITLSVSFTKCLKVNSKLTENEVTLCVSFTKTVEK